MAKLATICYIDNGEGFLLLYRNKKANDIHEGKWISVGGKFELGETPEACAIREIKEETGLTATDLDLKGIITFPNFQHDGEDWYSFVYRVREFTGQLNKDSDEGRLEWIPYNQILDMPTWEGDYIYLRWILEDAPFFSAQFTYDEAENLVDHSVVFHGNETKEV